MLEAGCGEGDLLAALPNARRHGIDYLPEVVARGARAPPRDRVRGRRRHAPARASRIGVGPSARTFDAVVCDRLCHSVLDVKALLLGLKRRLAPDGRIYLTAFNYLWEVPGARWRR